MNFFYILFFVFFLLTMNCELRVVPIRHINTVQEIMRCNGHHCEDYMLKNLIRTNSILTVIVNKKLDESLAIDCGHCSVLKTYCAILQGKRYIFYVPELDNFCIEELYDNYLNNSEEDELISLMNDLSV